MKLHGSFLFLSLFFTINNQSFAFGPSWLSNIFYPQNREPLPVLDESEHRYLNEHSFIYRKCCVTPTELYGDFAQEAYQRLKLKNPAYVALLDQPDIIYRLDDFLSFVQYQPSNSIDELVGAFKKNIGPNPLPPQTTCSGILFGDWPHLQKDALGFIQESMHRYGPDIVNLTLPGAGLFMYPRMLVLNPEIVQQVLLDTSGSIIKGDGTAPIRDQLFSPEGIIFMEANVRWKLLNKAFFEGPCNPKEFSERYRKLFQENFSWLVQRWNNKKEPFNLHKEITYYTMRVMSNAFFNYQLNDEQLIAVTDAFYIMLDVIHQRGTSVVKIPLIIPTSQHTIYHQALSVFNELLHEIVAKAPNQIKIEDKNYDTMIGILRHHQDPDTNQRLSYDEILSHVSTIFFAAHDTTANFITMLLHQLYTQPAWKEKIKQEITSKLDDRSKTWVPMGLLAEYTKFQDEVLRMYPSVPVIMVDTTREIMLGGYVIPAYTRLALIIYALQRNPLFYKNPDQFNPNRVEQDNKDYTPDTKKSFTAFTFGPRRCLGQWFALAEARNLVVQLFDKNIDLVFFDNDEEVYLKMACTGMPSRVISAAMQEQNKESSLQISNDQYRIKDITVRVSGMSYQDQANTVKTIRLEPLDGGALPTMYHPGDHAQLFYTDQNNKITMRHFSLSSSPTDGENWVDITVKNEPEGVISRIVHDELKVGDVLQVRLPCDDGVRVSEHDPADRPLVLISGGIGITPMISIAKFLCAKKWPGHIYFIHSAQTPEFFAFADQLNDFCKNNTNFHLLVTMTRLSESSEWQGPMGRISSDLINNLGIKNIEQARVYLCGKTSMCKEISNMLQEKCLIPSASLHTLSFGGLDWKEISGKKFTRSEIKKHNKRDDAWMIINGVVYDVTQYLALHPGLDIILDYLGQDATDIFNQIPHSAHAKKLLNESDVIIVKGIVSEPVN